ncbi:hypothetical protein BDU57DRAFT_85554 [Ampelomyces quisqualis]|uniref:RNA polymerase II assembly factor Rtp1 C-terminal domain-containing protein n=1 Tax=Ampelomyces quisqualis TaxID=50730 RepID=A0A6A5Q7J6_AMPQU|nr:hypothetical protein BDU57DRAFT_85554 [Ampelomyces quisqualis]
MGAVENAVDAAANLLGPFVNREHDESAGKGDGMGADELVLQSLSHIHAINSADLAADPDAPYDASIAGVVYGLLDLITSHGILPLLSAGVAFDQRPRSVIRRPDLVHRTGDMPHLAIIINDLMPIMDQKGTGLQPLLNQRILPDMISAIAELSFSPAHRGQHGEFGAMYDRVVEETPTSRLLPILTTFLQQPLPAWLKPVMAKQLAMLPVRPRGIRHTIEFLSLSYLSKISQVPQDTPSQQLQIPMPLEAITQASRLLVFPPAGISQEEWLRSLAPQLLHLLDGNEGVELSRAAGHIIAGGVLSKRATGAPMAIGWQLFALPLLEAISPNELDHGPDQRQAAEIVLVTEHELESALKRLSAIVSSYSHAGLLKRLIGPVLLPIWALLNYAQQRPVLDKKWSLMSQNILTRYMDVVCDPDQVDKIATGIFRDGGVTWVFQPGSHGGIEVRSRSGLTHGASHPENVLARVMNLDSRIGLFVSLLEQAEVTDTTLGEIFLRVTKRWLSFEQDTNHSLTDDPDTDPFAILINAKLSEAMSVKFQEQFARSPQHIVELMSQLISNYAAGHKAKVRAAEAQGRTSRASLANIAKTSKRQHGDEGSADDTSDEDMMPFAISVVSALVSSSGFQQKPATQLALASVRVELDYLSKDHPEVPVSATTVNSAKGLLQLLEPRPILARDHEQDAAAKHRATLKIIFTDLTSPEPPNRTWALNTLHRLMQDSTAAPLIDVPSTLHLLLAASLADPESYVHLAAIPVIVEFAGLAPSLVVRVLVEAFVDVDERSLKHSRTSRTHRDDTDLQDALDYRLRVGEVLSKIVLNDTFFSSQDDLPSQFKCLQLISEACLSLASRRAKRTQTLSTRTEKARAELAIQEEGEAAWGGPIPNLLDPEGESSQDQAERDALLKIVKGWEDTGIEDDARIRASALSVLSTMFETRTAFLRQIMVDAALQMVSLILTMEPAETKSILRRSAVMVIMGLLRGLDGFAEAGKACAAGFNMSQQQELTRVLEWVVAEDVDDLTRGHAASALEALETWRMKKLYHARDREMIMGADLGLEGSIRGLEVQPGRGRGNEGQMKLMVEELE